MKLLEIDQIHFWIWCADVEGKLASEEIRRKYFLKSYEVADILREYEDTEGLDEILVILFGLGFDNEKSRHEALAAVIKKRGDKLHPRYQIASKKVEEINAKLGLPENIKRLRKITP